MAGYSIVGFSWTRIIRVSEHFISIFANFREFFLKFAYSKVIETFADCKIFFFEIATQITCYTVCVRMRKFIRPYLGKIKLSV